MPKMTVVLELEPKSFRAPLCIVTALPQEDTVRDKIDPWLSQARQWVHNAEITTGQAISKMFRWQSRLGGTLPCPKPLSADSPR